MPYITEAARPAYNELATALLSRLERADWAVRLGAVLRELGVRLYGGPENTRYFKQNEFIGVLACMRLEWQHRLALASPVIDERLHFGVRPEPESSCSALIDTAVALLRQQPDESRAGHLNYFITRTMLEVVERGWCAAADVTRYMLSVEVWIYRVTTRLYEEKAMARSGDVFPPDWF